MDTERRVDLIRSAYHGNSVLLAADEFISLMNRYMALEEIERKAIEQSEYIQSEGLSPYEKDAADRKIARLEAENTELKGKIEKLELLNNEMREALLDIQLFWGCANSHLGMFIRRTFIDCWHIMQRSEQEDKNTEDGTTYPEVRPNEIP